MNAAGAQKFDGGSTVNSPWLVACVILMLGACTVKAGTLVAWGAGQQTPSGIGKVVTISVAADHSIALLEGGGLATWGYNFDQQLEIPPGLLAVKDAAAGEFFSVAVKLDGTVTAWGDNQFGQCSVPRSLINVTSVSAGRSHCLALRTDGTIVAWGNNAYGQCDPPVLANVRAVFAKWNYSLAVLSDGTVQAWGDNGAGQTSVPQGLNNVTAVTGGMDYCMALRNDGTVIGWGNYPAPPFPLNGILAIAAGEDHCLALISGGTVIAWGQNGSGQTSVPAGLSNVSKISAGWNYSAAIVSTGLGFVLANPTRSGNAFSVQVESQSGRSYTLEYKDNLFDPDWRRLTPISGTGSWLILSDSTATSNARVYRVSAQ